MVFGKKKVVTQPLPEPPMSMENMPSSGFLLEPPENFVQKKQAPRSMPMPAPPRRVEAVQPKPRKVMPIETVNDDSEGKSPPLFIKVDKYNDVVRNIHELKSYTLGMRDALDALAEIEKELANGIDLTNRVLDKLNTVLSLLDSKIVKLEGEGSDVMVPREIDEYVKNLYDQVEKIKRDLKSADKN